MSRPAGVDQKRMAEVIKAVVEEFRKLKTEKVSAEELRKAKDYLIGSMYLNLETSDSLADFYGYQEILRKKIKTQDEAASEIEKVTPEAISGLAESMFVDEKLNLAIIGRFKETSEFLPLLKL